MLNAGAAPAELVGRVEAALFGAAQLHRTDSDWARSALRANGLGPRQVPPESLRDVLGQPVDTGRNVPPESFVSTLLYAREGVTPRNGQNCTLRIAVFEEVADRSPADPNPPGDLPLADTLLEDPNHLG